ncbi:MAG TPA: phosphoribosylanthranilate isomerase, partial [Gemmatimonadales bacterium]
MQATGTPRIKICCIQNEAEAELAIDAGADALGFVSAMPSGPGPVDEAVIARVAARVPPPIATFLLTSAPSADLIIAQQRRCGTNTIQLVDDVPPGTHRVLRESLPGVRIVQVIHVIDESSVEQAQAVAPLVDALLLDSGNPTLRIKVLGGTGRLHNWALSRRIREAVKVPLFLAGGLRPNNVRAAIEAVRPFGVDVCSGLRTDGVLDP